MREYDEMIKSALAEEEEEELEGEIEEPVVAISRGKLNLMIMRF
jgi:hypothetical protein